MFRFIGYQASGRSRPFTPRTTYPYYRCSLKAHHRPLYRSCVSLTLCFALSSFASYPAPQANRLNHELFRRRKAGAARPRSSVRWYVPCCLRELAPHYLSNVSFSFISTAVSYSQQQLRWRCTPISSTKLPVPASTNARLVSTKIKIFNWEK
jgi:hypothetical protein